MCSLEGRCARSLAQPPLMLCSKTSPTSCAAAGPLGDHGASHCGSAGLAAVRSLNRRVLGRRFKDIRLRQLGNARETARHHARSCVARGVRTIGAEAEVAPRPQLASRSGPIAMRKQRQRGWPAHAACVGVACSGVRKRLSRAASPSCSAPHHAQRKTNRPVTGAAMGPTPAFASANWSAVRAQRWQSNPSAQPTSETPFCMSRTFLRMRSRASFISPTARASRITRHGQMLTFGPAAPSPEMRSGRTRSPHQ